MVPSVCEKTFFQKNRPTESGQKRVKICEGGFESNEDYTYVRGRGKGRYVCEECGIRCKKPSMLKKHIQTHTDLRPYTCKHCIFSFKTKGNLTKHLKSKAHYKKCVELGMFPVPTTVEDSMEDEGETRMDKYQNDNNIEEDSEEETDEDEEDDDEEEETEDEGDDCKTRRDVARSLLTLSEVTLETAHRQYVNAGLVSPNSRPRTFPYTLVSTQTIEQSVDKNPKSNDTWRLSPETISLDMSESSVSTVDSIEIGPEPSRPMDLSNKSPSAVKMPVITATGGQVNLLKTICTTTVSSIAAVGAVEDSTLLHTYLTEKAVRECRLKQKQRDGDSNLEAVAGAKESALGVLALSLSGRPPSPRKAEFIPPVSGPSPSFISSTEDGRSMCGVCNKVFNKPSQLRLHVNIHYFERPFRCDSCAVSFRSKGHLQKHQRSSSHLNKVNMNSTFGTATSSNPRPFKCDDCKIAFRIHGHLAKHLRSKMHIMKLECLGKLPFGTYAELERSGTNMNDIDTTDCENSLESLQVLAKKLTENDSSKLGTWSGPGRETSSEDEPEMNSNVATSTFKTDATPSSNNQNMCQRFEMNVDKCNEDDSLR